MKSAFLSLVFIPCFCVSAPKCRDVNGVPPEKRNEAIALEAEWLAHATYCDFGTYQVMLPTDPKIDAIVVFRGHKMFVTYDRGSGINLFQDFPEKKSVLFLSVQDWNRSGIFRRLDYALVDEVGNIIGNARDADMTGSLAITKYGPQPTQSQ